MRIRIRSTQHLQTNPAKARLATITKHFVTTVDFLDFRIALRTRFAKVFDPCLRQQCVQFACQFRLSVPLLQRLFFGSGSVVVLVQQLLLFDIIFEEATGIRAMVCVVAKFAKGKIACWTHRQIVRFGHNRTLTCFPGTINLCGGRKVKLCCALRICFTELTMSFIVLSADANNNSS